MKSAPGASVQDLALFGERLFARLPANLTQRLPLEERVQIASSAFEFFSTRTEPVKVRATIRSAAGEGAITVIESAMPDRAFIVDSLREYFYRLDVPIRLMLHPVFSVKRGPGGELKSFERAAAGEQRESFVHLELETAVSPKTTSEFEAEVRRRLGDVLSATDDFERMTARVFKICDELASARELVEVREFLRWLVGGGFVFLGYRRYLLSDEDGRRAIVVEAGSGLGILRDEHRSRFASPRSVESITPPLSPGVFDGPVLFIGKTRAESTVHRRARMDDVVIRRVDQRGRPVGFDRFLGLLTSKAYAEEAQHIPLLRTKLRSLLEAERAVPGSHDFKELVSLFNSFPKEELFRASVPELRNQLAAIIDAQTDDTVRVSAQSDSTRGMVVVLVIIPRERFSADVRLRIQDALARHLSGSLVYYYLAMSEGYTARLHFCFAVPHSITPEHFPALEREVIRIARSWEDRLTDYLVDRYGEARGWSLAARYAHAFSAEYKAVTDVTRAAGDIARIEMLLAGQREAVEIAQGDDASSSQLRIYDLGEPVVLSELMPFLQNFGIRVLAEDAHTMEFDSDSGTQRAYIETFSVQDENRAALSAKAAALFAEALTAVRNGTAESDPLNALTLSAGLSWREVSLLRAYLAAAFQMRLGPARPALRRVLLNFPALARNLVDLFVARMDPEGDGPGFEPLKKSYVEKLGAVENIADDRIARALLAMVEATVRTNYFQPVPQPDPYVALKFESAKIAELPDVPPLFEIHVNSPRMEGCHLRAGKIARGGIRASDRPDDYRIEILDLMKTQTVKNAIIVPIGSKGGFVVKGAARAGAPDESVSAYKTLIGATLDLTDNVVDGAIAHPPRSKLLDDDGPYLVVAADKGTAAFSDIANEIAEDRGFWLGDAFASGGKHGYDHKELGITARGAWESAKRHLREMGRIVDGGEPFTVVGIGDMSGDVFGNGMLQSNRIKLLAAFNHKHIFLDPDPDPASSFNERKRLYQLKGSQWSDYSRALISVGGGVFPRGQKRISLSKEARAALSTNATELDGESLVRSLLRASVDLLYNGGIGTYVRASDENDTQVGDHANDSCRITAPELRAKVVVEGGNLGFTQRARIEYALKGGRINTDAIDNSAGVDMSDHEVNLKILLQPARARGALTLEQRNQVLKDATAEVVDLVLRDNRDQALLLSLEQNRSRADVTVFRDHLTDIEQRGLLRRHEEALPTREALRERRSRYAGLTRPELAVLSAYTKLDLTRRLETSAFVDEPYLTERFLRPYFPASIASQFAAEIPRHQLHREIIATRLVNELVDLMGSTFVFTLVRDFGAEADAVVRAWLVAADLLDLDERAERLKRQSSALSVDAELSAFTALERAGERASRWALSEIATGEQIGRILSAFKPEFAGLTGRFEGWLAGSERARFEQAYREFRRAGQAEETAHDLARLTFSDHLLTALRLCHEADASAELCARTYFGLAEPIDFAMVETALEAIGGDDRWERRAARLLGSDLRRIRERLARRAVADCQSGNPAAAVVSVTSRREREFNQARSLLSEIRALPAITLPALQVCIRALAAIAET